jgi:hypothetical protein
MDAPGESRNNMATQDSQGNNMATQDSQDSQDCWRNSDRIKNPDTR